jgi:hypothetical protein
MKIISEQEVSYLKETAKIIFVGFVCVRVWGRSLARRKGDGGGVGGGGDLLVEGGFAVI